jgi:prepilin-type processing-associated H-X9-DG protein
VPLAWSRGLTNAGIWPPADGNVTGSCWGPEGGHIVYGDGHVSWCNDTAVTGQNYFTDLTGAPTANWLQSRGVPANALALPPQ